MVSNTSFSVYPTKFYVASGVGVSRHELTAFDRALIDAGVSNYNLVKVSSILPKNCAQVSAVDLEEGSPLLTAFATITSSTPGDQLATAVSVAVPKDKSNVGLIMEHSGHMTAEECEEVVREMAKEAMLSRGFEIESIITSARCGIVSEQAVSLISVVALW